MNSNRLLRGTCLLFIFLCLGCAARVRVTSEPPPFPGTFMAAGWGDSVDRVKAAIEKDGSGLFQDGTERRPYALYASGTYFGEAATFSYFFTPKSRKLYRIDVTYKDPMVFEKVKGSLIQAFHDPTYSKGDVDHWDWRNDSLVILQREPFLIQISYMNGPFLRINHDEGGT